MYIFNFTKVAYIQDWRRHQSSTYNYFFLKKDQKFFREIKPYNHAIFEWEKTLAVKTVLISHLFFYILFLQHPWYTGISLEQKAYFL